MKRLIVKKNIKELYNKVVTSNAPTYVKSSQDNGNRSILKTKKAKKESISLISIFVFWLHYKYLLARTAIKKEESTNEWMIEKSVDGVVSMKTGEYVNGGNGRDVQQCTVQQCINGIVAWVPLREGIGRRVLGAL